jgi:hypothetical protein
MHGVEVHLRRAIRQMILAGNLPKVNCRMTWYGPGIGGVCVACEQPITAEEMEVEYDLPRGVRSASIERATTYGRRSGLRVTRCDVLE